MRATLTSILIALLTLADPSPSQSQSLPNGFLTADSNSSSSYPFNTTSSHKWQWHYDSSQFVAPGPITITEIYVRAATPTATVQAFNFPSLVVTLASSPTDYSVAGSGGVPGHSTTFANNLNPDATVVRTGAWVAGPIPPVPGAPAAPWIPLGLTGTFTYDPTAGQDFVIQLEKCGTTTIWGTSIDGPIGTGAGTVMGNRYGDLSNCMSTTSSFSNNEYVPVVRIDYMPAQSGPEYQVNQSEATLDVNGIQGTSFMPAMVSLAIGQQGLVTIASASTGASWEIGYGTAPLVPRSAGALTTPDNQILNLDLSDPTFGQLWNGFGSPPFGNVQLPLIVNVPTTLSFQMAVLASTSPSGIALSQPLRLTVQ